MLGIFSVAAGLALAAGAQAPAAQPQKPRVYLRAEWGAAAGEASAADSEKKRIIIHHTDILVSAEEKALEGAAGWKAAAAHARQVQYLHKSVNGWADIGYHYLVDWEGRVLQGRPVDSLGAHTDGYNEGSIGIAVMGNFESQHATAAQLAGLRALVDWLTWSRKISPLHVLGHNQYNATACPGHYLADEQDPRNPLRLMRLSLLAQRKLSQPRVDAQRILGSVQMLLLPVPWPSVRP